MAVIKKVATISSSITVKPFDVFIEIIITRLAVDVPEHDTIRLCFWWVSFSGGMAVAGSGILSARMLVYFERLIISQSGYYSERYLIRLDRFPLGRFRVDYQNSSGRLSTEPFLDLSALILELGR